MFHQVIEEVRSEEIPIPAAVPEEEVEVVLRVAGLHSMRNSESVGRIKQQRNPAMATTRDQMTSQHCNKVFFALPNHNCFAFIYSIFLFLFTSP
jgi:hypothetical protein